ncbi:DUF202 domain-containing protein [Acidovorax sp.]|uniref:DUF202 domain-containing protein n=1 Tax=Acidovorax sp. TaxID=1872122 RepID=UPI001ACB4B8E|nr:DUF202 domain-containing protein [Acidovorax sp.]MBN9628233.1 DUF202 domain-containing protein [Acidovorax sp.]
MIPDPGLQPERTALAWQRTFLALLVNAVLLLRAELINGDSMSWVVCAALGGASVVLLAVARRRAEQLRRERPGLPRLEIALVTWSTLVMAFSTLLEVAF